MALAATAAPLPPLLPPDQVRTMAVVGTGSVGASWIALFLAHDIRVVAHDPGPDAEARTRRFVAAAWPALTALLGVPGKPLGQKALSFVASAGAAAAAGDAVQENVPERLSTKAAILAEIDAATAADRVILSSTGGIPPSTLQQACLHPARLVVLHPFNPTHLMPLVEVVGGAATAPAVIEWAMAFARRLGKRPIRLKREATGHLTNRLQFALLREAAHCLAEDIAGAAEIDDAVRYGLAPRWALMGSLLTLHLAGGPGGMAGILAHAGPAIDQWWSALGSPSLDPELQARMVTAADELAAGLAIDDWVRWRDDHLVQVVQLMAAAASPQATHSS